MVDDLIATLSFWIFDRRSFSSSFVVFEQIGSVDATLDRSLSQQFLRSHLQFVQTIRPKTFRLKNGLWLDCRRFGVSENLLLRCRRCRRCCHRHRRWRSTSDERSVGMDRHAVVRDTSTSRSWHFPTVGNLVRLKWETKINFKINLKWNTTSMSSWEKSIICFVVNHDVFIL